VGPSDDTTSLGISYMSSATTEGEADQWINDHHTPQHALGVN
jgi:hypothetical protein